MDAIAVALIAAKERGVFVKWVTDDKHGIEADSEEGHGQFAQLKQAGIEVRDDNSSGLMHNKFIIIDNEIVWTGSTNLTTNGIQRNNNNVIVMRLPKVAAIYKQEFKEMWRGQFGKSSPSELASQGATIKGTQLLVDENVVIIDSPEIASLYLEEFERRWKEGKQPDRSKVRCQ